MLNLPLAVHPGVTLFVFGDPPDGLRAALDHRARLQQIPVADRAVAVHLDTRVHHVVNGVGQDFGNRAEEGADGRLAFVASEVAAVPDRVVREAADELVFVALVGARTVVRLQLLDRFDVLQSLDPPFDLCELHGFLLCLPAIARAVIRPVLSMRKVPLTKAHSPKKRTAFSPRMLFTEASGSEPRALRALATGSVNPSACG